ncbi:pilin [Nocardiopsis trehalosi]|uniref:pilin n=1 Tax=Nocardiopsis trehalosi TaxID=109329 RepID=UPI000AE2663F|nr:pilin [Nocardiopsis trehalosi]
MAVENGRADPKPEARRRAAVVAAVAGIAAAGWVAAGLGEAAWAQGEDPAGQSTADLEEVVERLRNVIIALASAFATLLLTVGGLRWMLAGGDPSEIDRAKKALGGAAVGYGIAILATALMVVLDYIVKGAGK